MMFILIIIPAEFWNPPTHDSIYEGFDENLIFMDAGGNFPNNGLIEVTNNTMKITTVPNSQPTIHLVTTPFDNFQIEFDVRILDNAPFSSPLKIGLWSPRSGSGYFVDFESSPTNLISTKLVTDGLASKILEGGEIIGNSPIFNYNLDQKYHLKFNVDKQKNEIIFNISENISSPSGNPMLRLSNSEQDGNDVISDRIKIEGGTEYTFGGFANLLNRGQSYKIDLEWFDINKEHLGYVDNWRTVNEINGWTYVNFSTIAPTDASYVSMLLGVDNETKILCSDLFLKEINSNENLLINGNFIKGFDGWNDFYNKENSYQIFNSYFFQSDSKITDDDLPELFNELRITFTISSQSTDGISIAIIENYSLTLNHQRSFTVKVNDLRLTVLVILLAIISILLIINQLYIIRSELKNNIIRYFNYFKNINFQTQQSNNILIGFLIIISVIIINLFLFSLGNLPFDMLIEKIWAYIAVKQSPIELYHLPSTVSLAQVWGGTPYHEAVFPYNFGFVYLFTIIGQIYNLFFNGPGPLVMDTFMLEFVIKSFNLVFMVLDGILIYLILKEYDFNQKHCIVAFTLFLFNPAVWFIGSIWGQTHLISIFFLLLSLWLAKKKQVLPAWIVLFIGSLNRPQMLIPLFLAAGIFLKRFSWKKNVNSIFWSIIFIFLLLTPFSLTISPSTPVDIFRNQIFVQEAGGNDPALTLVSLDTYNVWPLLSYFQGARGLERIQYPSTSTLIEPITYQQASQFLSILVILVSLILIIFYEDSLLSLTFGTVGFLILKTGLASTHFMIAFPLLILCRKYFGDRLWYIVLAIWTSTMLIPMYGTVGFSIETSAQLMPALHSSNNFITKFFMTIYSSDWCISLGSLGNLIVLIILGFKRITYKLNKDL